jgi:integrase
VSTASTLAWTARAELTPDFQGIADRHGDEETVGAERLSLLGAGFTAGHRGQKGRQATEAAPIQAFALPSPLARAGGYGKRVGAQARTRPGRIMRPRASDDIGIRATRREGGPRGRLLCLHRRVLHAIDGVVGMLAEVFDPEIDPEALRLVNAEQRRTLAALLSGTDPLSLPAFLPAALLRNQADERSGLTIERGFELYLSERGPIMDVSREQRRRYERTCQHTVREFGPGKLASAVTTADLEGFANARRIQLAEQSPRASNGGSRQAEIEVICILAVVNWLATSYGAQDVNPLRAPELLKRLRELQVPARPRFTDDEFERMESLLSTADPRLAMLLTIQGAQRAGQLLRTKRSGLSISQAAGQVRAVLQVPGSKNKKGGRHFLTPSASLYLEAAIGTGHLRELERTYHAQGTDYYLFPGGVGRLAATATITRGDKAWDRTVALKVFKELQEAAGVVQMAKRGFHGFRRRAVDVLVALGATPSEIRAAGAWRTNQIPLDIYHEGVEDGDGARAAALLESPRGVSRLGDSLRERPTELEIRVDYPETSPDLAQTLKAQNLTDAEVDEVLELSQWAWEELNLRPHAYQACALTT